MSKCRLNPPDTMILSRGLTNLVGPLMATHQDINFRLQCSRSMLHIDRMPTLDETKEYAKHILSEMEIAAAAVNSAGGPKLRALGQATQPNNPPQSLQRQPGTKPICKYFMSDKGCRKGPACAYLHDMSSLDKAQRSRKCLKCGSTEHRQKQCPSVTGKPPAESPGGKAKGGALPKAPQPTSPASSVTPTSPVSPVGLAQITQPVLDSTQLVVNPTAKPTSSSSTQAAASPIAAAVSGPAASGFRSGSHCVGQVAGAGPSPASSNSTSGWRWVTAGTVTEAQHDDDGRDAGSFVPGGDRVCICSS